MDYRILLALAGTVVGPASTNAAILLGLVNEPQTFDSQPFASEWATTSIGTSAGSYGSHATLDAAIQTVAATAIAARLPINTGAQGTNQLFRWSQTNMALES